MFQVTKPRSFAGACGRVAPPVQVGQLRARNAGGSSVERRAKEHAWFLPWRFHSEFGQNLAIFIF